MKKAILIGVLVLVGVSVAYCQHFWIPYTWHQKMTVEVEMDGQLYTGASVVKVTVSDSDPLTKGLGYSSQFGAMGEAAFVELPGKRYLFALLDGGGHRIVDRRPMQSISLKSNCHGVAMNVLQSWQNHDLKKTFRGLTIPFW